MMRLTPPAKPNITMWQVSQPPETHRRPATCKEVDCPHWLMGWQTIVNEAERLGQMQAAYIRRESGRAFTEARNEAGLTVFTFAADQRCFGKHTVTLDRPAVFRKDGREMVGDDWLDDNKETLYRLERLRQRG